MRILTRSFIRLFSSGTLGPRLGLSLKDARVQAYLREFQRTENASNRIISSLVTEIQKRQDELNDLACMVKECQNDSDLKSMAEKDKLAIENSLLSLEDQFFDVLASERDPGETESDELVVEVNAGVGGQEAMLFAQELFSLYEKYALFRGWRFELANYAESDSGGVRHAAGSIIGRGSFSQLKYEGGIHRVQRVPKTEKSGRIHTSTATVAILPAPSEIQVIIKPEELREEVKRSSGAGGQHVNTTESAVRLTHIPTGISVDCQMERCQIQNRAKAHKLLRAKIYERMSNEAVEKRNSARKLQVGLSARSDKIRTYNFVQDRVTDHRIGLTLHNLEEILGGGELFGSLLENLEEFDKGERLMQLFEGYNTKSSSKIKSKSN